MPSRVRRGRWYDRLLCRLSLHLWMPDGTCCTCEARDEQRLQDISHRAGCEQILNALTPPYKRNPTSIAKALAEDGYAVYDGPVQPSKGSGDNQ